MQILKRKQDIVDQSFFQIYNFDKFPYLVFLLIINFESTNVQTLQLFQINLTADLFIIHGVHQVLVTQ
jgi:hypothetical protein